MKKNISMTIKRVNKNINNEIFIKNEDYNKFEKDFYYNREFIIKDLNYVLNYVLNILLKYFNKIKIILLLIFFIITIYYFFYNNNSKSI